MNEHYSNKGSHFMRQQAAKVEKQVLKREGILPEIQYEQRRFINNRGIRKTPHANP